MIGEGSKAPSFDAPSTGGRFRLEDVLETGTLVLFFYPKADTPGCTNEATEFEAWFDRFEDLGVRVAGCSVDDLEAQEAFARKHTLRFPLISDTDGSIARSFEVFLTDRGRAARATAVISEDGTVLKAYPQAPPDGRGHAEAVFADVRALLP